MGGRLEKTEKYTRELAMGLDSESVPDDKEKILSSDDDMDDEDLYQFIVDTTSRSITPKVFDRPSTRISSAQSLCIIFSTVSMET